MSKKIIFNLKGGIGNQMFQYAFAHNIASKFKLKLLFDNSYNKLISQKRKIELEKLFNIKLTYASKSDYYDLPFYLRNDFIRVNLFRRRYRYITPLLSKKIIYEKSMLFSEKYINISSDVKYFDGYWQSYKYHDLNIPINKVFAWKNINSYSKKVENKICDYENTVSIHIRRGDYIKKKNFLLNIKKNLLPLNTSYYYKSINYFRERFEDIKFFFFSEDVKYVSDFVKEFNINSYIVDSEKSGLNDMYLMSKCRNNIIANSTFSWWGAYLNKNKDKKVIAPEIWFSSNSNKLTYSLYPPDWLIL